MTYSSCSSLLLVLVFFLFYSSSCSNFLIFHFADFIHLTKACMDGVLLIPFSVSFVSLNYACIVGWNCCNIYMVGCLYVEFVMYDGTMHVIYMVGWWSYVVDILYVCSVMAFWNISIYVIYICDENCWI